MSHLEGLVDDADLWAVAVRDDDVNALLDHLGDELGAAGDTFSLLFGIIAQGVAANAMTTRLPIKSVWFMACSLGRNGSLSRIARRLALGTLVPALLWGMRQEALPSFNLPRSRTCATAGCVR